MEKFLIDNEEEHCRSHRDPRSSLSPEVDIDLDLISIGSLPVKQGKLLHLLQQGNNFYQITFKKCFGTVRLNLL